MAIVEHRLADDIHSIIAAYFVGLAVLASGLARFAYIDNLLDASNPSRYYSHFILIAVIEANASQICCCLPAVRHVVTSLSHGTDTDT
jgi:hypothetical protein